MGITRIDVKTSGIGYSQPTVLVDNEVPDDFTPPTGGPINGGFDVLAGEGPSGEEGGGSGIGPKSVEKYSVEGFPFLAMVDGQGDVIEEYSGDRTKKSLHEFAQKHA